MWSFLKKYWFKAGGDVREIQGNKKEIVLTGKFYLEGGTSIVPAEAGSYTLIIEGSPASTIAWSAGNKIVERIRGKKISFSLGK